MVIKRISGYSPFLRLGVMLLFTLLALALSVGRAQASTTLDVTTGGGGYNSIQDAVNAAPITTDTVLIRVAQGHYNEHVDISNATSITIEGGWNNAFTSRDGNSKATIVRSFQVYNTTATIDDFTAYGSDNNAFYANNSDLILRNIRAVNSSYDGNGPGVYASSNKSLAIYDSVVAYNATNDGNGGGIYVSDGTFLLKNSSVHDNQVNDDGSYGGGLYIRNTTATIENSWIYGNGTQYTDGESEHGGIYSYNNNLSITNSVIYGNYATENSGGGLYYVNDDFDKNGLSISNSTFADNFAATDDSGGVDIREYASTTDTIQIRDSILWGNLEATGTPPYFQESDLNIYKNGGATTPTLDINYNDIGRSTGLPFTGIGNISANPLYVDPVNDDYHLATGSPAIDAADPLGATSMDIDGDHRPVGSGYDMGADEYLYTPPPISPLTDWDFEGARIVTGDFTGDGNQDVIALYGYEGNRAKLWSFASNGSSLNGAEEWWDSGPGNWNAAAAQIVPGDFDADGWLDVAAFYAYGNNQSRIFLFANNHHGGFNTATLLWDSGPHNWNGPATQIVTGDFNGDSQSDIAALYSYGGSRSRVWLFKGNSGALDAPVIAWDSGPGNWEGRATKLTTGDFNNDGKTDIGSMYGYRGNQTRFFTSAGQAAGIGAPKKIWDSGLGNWNAGASQVVSGDFDGDGQSDLGALYAYGGKQARLWIFTTNPAANGFESTDLWWDSGPGNWDGFNTKIASGDFDGDGQVSSVAALYRQTSPRTDLWIIGPLGVTDTWQRQM